MSTITFDGVELKNVSGDFDQSPELKATVTILASGQKSIQTTTVTGFSRTYYCTTNDYTDIQNLLAKVGVSGTLVEGSTSYTGCKLTKWIALRSFGDEYEYAVKIERDTA